MPVKLITSDARKFFSDLAAHLSELDKRLPHLEKNRVLARQIRKRKSEVESVLFNNSFWDECDESPGTITDPSAGTNGDWNGIKLGNFKIRGKLVSFKNALFDVTGLYTKEEAKLLVLKTYQTDRSEIEFMKSRSGEPSSRINAAREHIPERVRNEVWRRDDGKCVECGSVYRLEFDHVIPIAKGGSNTARNLRILCESCNRRKSDTIG